MLISFACGEFAVNEMPVMVWARSLIERTRSFASVAPVMAEIANGASCTFSSRFCAVTTISSRLVALVLFVWAVGSIELIDTFKNFSTEWYWYILAIIYTVTINDLFVHICLGHKIYPIHTNRIGYKILAFLATVDNAWGPISSMCLVHRNHHLYSDRA